MSKSVKKAKKDKISDKRGSNFSKSMHSPK